VPPTNMHAIPTDAPSEEDAARQYEAELRAFYGADRLDPARPLFDLVLMGVGSDGHTASLFPGKPQVDETKRWVVGVPDAGMEPFVPRVSLTFPALASTRDMLFLVTGRGKREILSRILAGADLPAARAHSDGELVWLVDRDAAPERRDVA
jgi:6-phosphogluconolactonase